MYMNCKNYSYILSYTSRTYKFLYIMHKEKIMEI